MLEYGSSEIPTGDDKARRLVAYARGQAEPTLHARLVCEPHELPADLFPGYTIVAKVGGGGQGRVYEAVDNSTQRRVAIKVLRSGPFGDEAVRGRFEREIQILAQLQHPNIVTIHSSGTVALQRYFVMDFIEGQPLDAYLAGNHLSMEKTLAVFLRICEAVNAAHLRGIVHRDLKPGNIRIDDHGDPHVLDFGLAKTVPGHAGGAPSSMDATIAGQFVGSLPWAAPEQMMNVPTAIDLRTDVYGLGLVLYFLLTRSLPYERGANLRDMTDSILHGDPTRPSTLRREVDDELDTIVLMCLQKEPDRRYQIAGELARDIRRYRAGQPIEAKRDHTGYLLAKTLRRHRGLAMLAAAFVVISVGYAATISLLYQRATNSEQLANERADDVSKQYATTQEAIGFLIDEVSSKLNHAAGNALVRRDILQGAFDRLLPLIERHGDDPLLLKDLMRAHYQLGDIAIALRHFDTAAVHLQKALELRLQLSPREAKAPNELADLSINYVLLGDAAQKSGDMKTCERTYAEALDIDEALVAAHPGNAHFLDNLAWSYNRLSCFADERQNDLQKAKELALKQRDIMERLTEAEPDNATRLNGLAAALDRLVKIALRVDDSAAITNYDERRLAISNRMIAAAPDDPYLLSRHILAVSQHFVIAGESTPEGRVDGILGLRTLVDRLLRLEPDMPRSHYTRIIAFRRLLRAALDSGNPRTIIAAANEVIADVEAYAELAPPNVEVVSSHALALNALRNVCKSQWDAGLATGFDTRSCEAYGAGIASSLKLQKMRIAGLDLRLDNDDITTVERQEIIAKTADVYREAVASIEAAFEVGVDSPELRIQLAEWLQNDTDASETERIAAINAARQSVESAADPKPAHIASVGRLYQAAGMFDAAIEMLEQAETAYMQHAADLPEADAHALRACRAALGG